LLAEVLLKPRAEIAQVLASDCATSSPAPFATLAMLVTPERRMSSLVMTAIAAAASESFSASSKLR